MTEVSYAALDRGHMFEGDGPEYNPRPPALFTLDWWGATGLLFGRVGLILLPSAILLALIMACAERESEERLSAWLRAGCASAVPLALYLMASVGLGRASPPNRMAYMLLLLLPCALGALGSVAAWRVRPPGRPT
jgi:hypothetical protein